MKININKKTVTSIETAEFTGEQHKNVFEAIYPMRSPWKQISRRKFRINVKFRWSKVVIFSILILIMDIKDFILPDGILDYFEIVDLKKEGKRYDIYLDERSIVPDSDYSYSSKGFTQAKTVQVFPTRGHTVFLHIRRRKWLEKETGRIVIREIDISHTGTELTEEFASFLKKRGSSPK